MIKRLTIIGVGLIGSSLSLALKKSAHVEHVTGCGRSQANLEKGVELGVLDDFSLSIAEAVEDSDVVVVAVPLGAMRPVFSQVARGLSSNTVITDVGSSKGSVVQDARAELGANISRFVAGHPIAGTEQSGVEAGFATLFEERKVIPVLLLKSLQLVFFPKP